MSYSDDARTECACCGAPYLHGDESRLGPEYCDDCKDCCTQHGVSGKCHADQYEAGALVCGKCGEPVTEAPACEHGPCAERWIYTGVSSCRVSEEYIRHTAKGLARISEMLGGD